MNPDHHTGKQGKWKQLSETERYKIEGLLEAGHSAGEIARQLRRDRRTIQREIKRGEVIQRRENPYKSRSAEVPFYLDEPVYKGDAGQRAARELAANKGRGLKIGHDHELARHLEKRIGKDGFSPDAALGEIREQGIRFRVTVCTRTVYNMIDRGDFLHLTNASLPVKRGRKKRRHRQDRKVALNNRTGRSIEERPRGGE